MTVNSIIHEDEITIWWDKEWELDYTPIYSVILDGKKITESTKTYVTLSGLTPDTLYTLSVEREGVSVSELRLRTAKAKIRIDVMSAPYFAKGDGITLNTEALQRAINDCTAGACVYFPRGVFLTGALDLHSDMEIYLDEGAVIQGTAEVSDYLPKVLSRFEGIEMMCHRSLLNIGKLDHTSEPTCKNVVIRGKGSILGGGAALAKSSIETERALLADYLAKNDDYVKTCENDDTIPGRVRGRLIHIANCENIIISGLRLGFAASWNVHFIYSKNIVTYGCKIDSIGVWNGDGWDPDSSEDCTIFNCEFATHDNSIAVKSGKNPEGNIIARPTRNVRIFDCRGRECMALGSEMSGGVRDVYIWDCDFSKSGAGLSIKVTKKRGGYIKNVRVADSAFSSIRARTVTFNDDGESAPTAPIVEDFLFSNVMLTGVSVSVNGTGKKTEALLITGPDDENSYFKNFTFENLHIKSYDDLSKHKFEMNNAKGLEFKNIYFD